MPADPDTRPEPEFAVGERATLEGFLDYQRATLAWKCSGVADADLRRRCVEPSPLSLLGIVRHMAEVERGWFRHGVAGEERTHLFCSEEDPDADFDGVDDADVAAAFAAWAEECASSRAIIAGRSLDETFSKRGVSLRWLLCHMIEEYARHNGHADLLRERIDGATGE
jgi:uncharacterized damage-inducible protein DinB